MIIFGWILRVQWSFATRLCKEKLRFRVIVYIFKHHRKVYDSFKQKLRKNNCPLRITHLYTQCFRQYWSSLIFKRSDLQQVPFISLYVSSTKCWSDLIRKVFKFLHFKSPKQLRNSLLKTTTFVWISIPWMTVVTWFSFVRLLLLSVNGRGTGKFKIEHNYIIFALKELQINRIIPYFFIKWHEKKNE